MKKNVMVFAMVMLFVFLIFLSFRAGKNIGYTNGVDSVKAEYFFLNKNNSVAEFRSYVELSQSIRDGFYGKAQCSADLLASARFDEIQSCIASELCGEAISMALKELPPGILEKNKGFRYFKDREECSH